MRRYLLSISILAVLLLGGIAYAQESPFGGLAGDQDSTGRTVNSIEGVTINTYWTEKENFDNLQELYLKAYSTRKTELDEQRISKAKDVLISKLGATLTYLKDLYTATAETGRFSEEGMKVLKLQNDAYVQSMAALQEAIEASEKMSSLSLLAARINEGLVLTLSNAQVHIAMTSITRGEYIIEQIEKQAPVIQAHINASAVLGGAVEDLQKVFDSSMLSMEEARDEQAVIASMLGDGIIKGVATQDSLGIRVTAAHRSLREAVDGIVGVLKDLRQLYSNSPWEIDTSQFETREEPAMVGDETETEPEETEAMDATDAGSEETQ